MRAPAARPGRVAPLADRSHRDRSFESVTPHARDFNGPSRCSAGHRTLQETSQSHSLHLKECAGVLAVLQLQGSRDCEGPKALSPKLRRRLSRRRPLSANQRASQRARIAPPGTALVPNVLRTPSMVVASTGARATLHLTLHGVVSVLDRGLPATCIVERIGSACESHCLARSFYIIY